ncbi:hypothetical protein [Nocardia blacklockiae]|uniref:hypothetical protein n=1 Tax=Nocardia blacklockiae TaxID=480036 RepID=UPI001893ACF9|nr:hypothetical protein [Nocardia blacklockiae]MBF6173603.1 hypothetical protein [Nocardia blacklockiae]
MHEPGPALTADDIHGGCQQVNNVTLFTERHGVRLRYRLHLDDVLTQSAFTVDVYSREQLAWNTVWSVSPDTYRYPDGPTSNADLMNPASQFIASPLSRDTVVKTASWQKIVNALTDATDRVLRPATPGPAPGTGVLPAVSTYLSTDDGATVVEIDTLALDTARRCRVYVNTRPVYDARPETGDHDTEHLGGYLAELLRAQRGSR